MKDKRLKEELKSTFRDISVSISDDAKLIIDTKKRQALNILKFLKDKGYDHLALMSCVDWIEEKEFELVYILTSYGASQSAGYLHIILKTRIPRNNPQFSTITSIFKNASAYERELHELFGINFEGHPNLKPLFLEREYKIPPFRKDFDTRKYVEDTFDKIPTIEGHNKNVKIKKQNSK